MMYSTFPLKLFWCGLGGMVAGFAAHDPIIGSLGCACAVFAAVIRVWQNCQ
jgi:hypothetical protein